MRTQSERELVDEGAGLVIRQLVVGPLDTNCWVVFSPADHQAVIIDPGDEPRRIIDACADLDPAAVVLTHEHWDHVLALPEVADHFGVEVLAHPAERAVWRHELRQLDRHGHFDAGTATGRLLARGAHLGLPPGQAPWTGTTRPVGHGDHVVAGDLVLGVRHTPGHTPGGLSLAVPGHVFTGDTLFPGGPGLTGWPLSDFDTIIDSISNRLFTLPADTIVHPGHGPSTTVGAERPHLHEWIERGW